ncbi:hypothetical protein [Nocardioides mesophilus]|uniref:DUF4064 domain-containing protein n=1 Tax=Nocardioides mesophilus TaxID=433659 RepID=A0A7G9RF30_9ACTN|nr:hypothetical protein [Nocardioides mesophilus]QNN54205.1 hypothetical protein H9L09_07600 [Nocardioides mesophilus]
MAESNLPRPRQVTMAAGIGLVASLLLVVSLFDALTRLRSVEMRAAIDDFLAREPGSGLGLDADAVASVLRALVFLDGALAATAAVLAVYVFQRHRAARIGFSVAAGLLLLTSPVTGGALALLVAFAATLLWGRPARDWFAGRAPQPLDAATGSRSEDGAADGSDHGRQPSADAWPPPRPPVPADQWPPVQARPVSRSGEESSPEVRQPPPAAQPFGQRPEEQSAPVTSPSGWPPPGARPSPAGATSSAPTATGRPGSVVAATVLTFVAAGLTALLFAVVVAGLVLAKDTVVDVIEQNPEVARMDLNTQDVLAALWVLSALILFWCLAAMALAFLTFRRVGWARLLLVVSAVASGLLGLVAFPVGLVVTALAAATVWLLLGRASNAWFAGGGTSGPPYPPPPASPTPGQQPQPYGQQPQPPYGQQPQPPYGQQPPAPEQQPQGGPQRPQGKPPVW